MYIYIYLDFRDDLEQQLHEERQMALEEKERLMEHMWGEKQALVYLYLYVCIHIHSCDFRAHRHV